jgi:hypothetical protein
MVVNLKAQALLKRAAWTFAQAFGAVFLTGLTLSVTQVQLKALVVAAFAAGLSALKSVAFTPPEVL